MLKLIYVRVNYSDHKFSLIAKKLKSSAWLVNQFHSMVTRRKAIQHCKTALGTIKKTVLSKEFDCVPHKSRVNL